MADAVSGWSPVATSTRTPAARSCDRRRADSRRRRQRVPARLRPAPQGRGPARAWGGRREVVGHAVDLRSATARTRRPSAASRSTRARASPASGQRSSTTSGAPLTTSRPPRRPRRNRAGGERQAAPGRRRGLPCDGLGHGPVDLVHVRVGRRPPRRPAASRSTSSSGVPSWGGHEADHAQPVLGQRAGLVEADGVDPAERLQHPRAAHDGAAAGQPPRGGLLGDRRDQRQPLGHRGDGDRQPGLDRLPERAPPQHAPAGDGSAAGEGQRQHRAGQLAEPRLHPGGRRGDTGGRASPGPRLGRGADGDDDGPAPAGHDDVPS